MSFDTDFAAAIFFGLACSLIIVPLFLSGGAATSFSAARLVKSPSKAQTFGGSLSCETGNPMHRPRELLVLALVLGSLLSGLLLWFESWVVYREESADRIYPRPVIALVITGTLSAIRSVVLANNLAAQNDALIAKSKDKKHALVVCASTTSACFLPSLVAVLIRFCLYFQVST